MHSTKETTVLLRRRLATLQPELLAYANSLALDASEAEDLTQDAVVRALQARSTPQNLHDLRPWMFRVIKNLLIDRRRKERVQREYSATHDRLSGIGITTIGDAVEKMIVRQAYANLGRRDREILCLIDILGLTYTETAQVIDIPIGTVMSRISRARRAMIAQINESNVRPMRRRNG